jgi:hypothetical protein
MLRSMLRSIIVLPLLLLTSCAADPSIQETNPPPDKQGGAAPITHEPYGSEMKEFKTHPPSEQTWKPGPPSLPKGAQICILEGDPAKEGPFVFRLKLPDGYTIAPHTHPRAERLTVIEGTFHIAEWEGQKEGGDTLDTSSGKGKTMPAGSFGYWPARMHHYAWTSGGGETTIQLHGFGPWKIEYLNPQDDPRNAKKD